MIELANAQDDVTLTCALATEHTYMGTEYKANTPPLNATFSSSPCNIPSLTAFILPISKHSEVLYFKLVKAILFSPFIYFNGL